MRMRKKEIKINRIKDFSKYQGCYCLIRRSGNEVGLFSHFLTNLGNIALAINYGLIPVIDMKNCVNTWTSLAPEKDINPWEYFFRQPCSLGLDDIMVSDTVIIQDDVPDSHKRPSDSMEFLTNDKAIRFWQDIVDKYIHLSVRAENYFREQYDKLLKGKKAIGVLCRGTDYVAMGPVGHPVQPKIEDIIDKVREIMKFSDCDYIFLATEDKLVYKQFREAFSDRLLILESDRFEHNVSTYLYDVQKTQKTDVYRMSLEYLTSIYLLSKCNGLVAGRTSGSVGALLLARGYQYCYYFNEGRYGINDFIV